MRELFLLASFSPPRINTTVGQFLDLLNRSISFLNLLEGLWPTPVQYTNLKVEVQNAMHLVWAAANLLLASTDKYMGLFLYLAGHDGEFTLIYVGKVGCSEKEWKNMMAISIG